MQKPVGQVLIVALMLPMAAMNAWADKPTQQPLFTIERSKNSNVVQYDAQVDDDGRLYRSKPVVAYWIRPEKEDRIKQLTWLQKTFAYGFKAKLNRDRTVVTLDLVADIGRPVNVSLVEDTYRASMCIDGVESFIERMFIHSTGSGASTQVEYIDLYGRAVDGGVEHYERITQ